MNAYRTHYSLINHAFNCGKYISAICVIASLGALIGHIFNIDVLYRPIPEEPATNTMSAICITCISLALFFNYLHDLKKSKALIYICFIILAIRSTDFLSDNAVNHILLIYLDPQDLGENEINNQMGFNTFITLIILNISALFCIKKRESLSQLSGFIALIPPAMSISGYIYHVHFLYGSMSLLTTIYTLALSAATLLSCSHHGVMKALLSPHIGGKLARYQIVIGLFCVFNMGHFIVHELDSPKNYALVAIFSFFVCWLISFLIGVGAVIHDRNDLRRRQAEQLLALRATQDPLTKLLNKKAFEDLAEKELKKQKRTKVKLGLLMIDVDFFKKVNDTFGHPMGDKVLQHVAEALKHTLRQTDNIGRYGGEEFIVLLNTTRFGDLEGVAEKVRASIEWMQIEGFTASNGPLTVSIGGACINEQMDFAQAISQADEALYAAKKAGRNCVMIHRNEPHEPLVFAHI